MSADASPRGVKNIFSSGSVFIDGVLTGLAWSQKSIEYAFPTKGSSYSYNGQPDKGFNAISQAQRETAMFALDEKFGNSANDGFSVEGFTNLKISKGGDKTAELRFAETNYQAPTAFAFFPSTNSRGGDVWFGTKESYRDPVPGTYASVTMLHEIGHALGLKHGHQSYGNFGIIPNRWDSQEYSLMTYTNFIGDNGSWAKYEKFGAPQTFMMADIAALQHMYGADFTTNSGKTVYSWKPGGGETYVNGKVAIDPGGNRIFGTIWDGGGTDTYNLKAYSTDLTIDLRPGSFSKFSSTQLADLGGGPNHGHSRGNIFNALMYKNNDRSLIENAIGGSGDDYIVGNFGKNDLIGNSGRDKLFGLEGRDRLVGGVGGDFFYFARDYDKDTIRDFQDGVDKIWLSKDLGINSKAQALNAADKVHGDVVFDFGKGDVLVVEDIKLGKITEADLMF